ncbi:stress response translation initiation inhibitor YciH [Simplicispira suum]|nr:stress response translation initiation inhibitor YciH [Simplicispira suum]MCO5105235.1 stress response translation initiation inhibitor YciH [Burkholderiaceae bacterium]
MCPACRQAVSDCVCAQARPVPAGDGTARVCCETKGRRGKAVTVVRGLALEQGAMADLARALKTACGVGGTLKDGVIELQGEHMERVLAELAARGLRTKRAA